jgi:hypothetical protein
MAAATALFNKWHRGLYCTSGLIKPPYKIRAESGVGLWYVSTIACKQNLHHTRACVGDPTRSRPTL